MLTTLNKVVQAIFRYNVDRRNQLLAATACALLLSTNCINHCKMRSVVVRIPPGDNIVYIDYDLGFKKRCFQRDKNEVVNRVLSRIKLSHVNQKGKKKKSNRDQQQQQLQDASAIQAFLIDQHGNRIDDNASNGEAWPQAKQLLVGDLTYVIDVNPPKIISLRLPDVVMDGFPVVPMLTTEFTTSIKYQWFIQSADTNKETLIESNLVNYDDTQITVFIPKKEYIGSTLKLICTTYNEQHTEGSDPSIVTVTVTPGPGVCPFETTHLYTRKRLTDPDCFRIVSYNILADTYTSTEHTQTVLFPYCPSYALNIDYRKLLITRELYGYNADIICLQECDKAVFKQFYAPFMKGLGYGGVQDSKINNAEGEAILYRIDRFNVIDHQYASIAGTLKNLEIFQQICRTPTLKDKLMNRNSIMQILTLQPKQMENIRLIVINTHFYFRHNASHIRAIQGYCMLKYVEEYCKKYSDYDVRILYCGDFNSHPKTAFVKLMTSGYVEPSHSVWHEGGQEEFCERLSLQNNQNYISFTGYPKFTNFVVGFVECLDYIFGQPEHFQVEQVFPYMSEDTATIYTALPSVVSPSDHIAIGCDLRLK